MSRQIVEIETKTFVRFWLVMIGFILLGAFIVKASEALVIIAIAVILAIAIRPLTLRINKFIGKKTKSNIPSVLAYLLVLLIIAAIVAVIAPVIVTEFSKFITTLPETVKHADLSALNEFGRNFGIENASTELVNSIETLSKNILSGIGADGVISGISTIGGFLGKAAITLILTLFLLLDGPDMINALWDRLGAKRTTKEVQEEKDRDTRLVTEARVITQKMASVVSTFISKQVLIALLDGIASGLSVLILSLIFGLEPHLAIPMGLITMTFYLIPMFGQVIGAALVTLILAFNSLPMAIIWLAFYLVYGFVEVNVFAPKVQGNALKLRPVVILISITIGTYVLGLFGAIIAIPIAGCIKVLVDELPAIRALRA